MHYAHHYASDLHAKRIRRGSRNIIPVATKDQHLSFKVDQVHRADHIGDRLLVSVLSSFKGPREIESPSL
jgi:hypothetical protein